jgi:translation initiation factor 2A
MIQDL